MSKTQRESKQIQHSRNVWGICWRFQWNPRTWWFLGFHTGGAITMAKLRYLYSLVVYSLFLFDMHDFSINISAYFCISNQLSHKNLPFSQTICQKKNMPCPLRHTPSCWLSEAGSSTWSPGFDTGPHQRTYLSARGKRPSSEVPLDFNPTDEPTGPGNTEPWLQSLGPQPMILQTFCFWTCVSMMKYDQPYVPTIPDMDVIAVLCS